MGIYKLMLSTACEQVTFHFTLLVAPQWKWSESSRNTHPITDCYIHYTKDGFPTCYSLTVSWKMMHFKVKHEIWYIRSIGSGEQNRNQCLAELCYDRRPASSTAHHITMLPSFENFIDEWFSFSFSSNKVSIMPSTIVYAKEITQTKLARSNHYNTFSFNL